MKIIFIPHDYDAPEFYCIIQDNQLADEYADRFGYETEEVSFSDENALARINETQKMMTLMVSKVAIRDTMGTQVITKVTEHSTTAQPKGSGLKVEKPRTTTPRDGNGTTVFTYVHYDPKSTTRSDAILWALAEIQKNAPLGAFDL